MAARIHVCRKVEYIYVQKVESIDGSSIVLKSGQSFSEIKVRNAALSEKMQQSKAGDNVNQTLDFVNQFTDNVVTDFMNKALIFRLQFSDGTTIIWGSLDNPVQTSNINKEISAGKTIFFRKYVNAEFQ